MFSHYLRTLNPAVDGLHGFPEAVYASPVVSPEEALYIYFWNPDISKSLATYYTKWD